MVGTGAGVASANANCRLVIRTGLASGVVGRGLVPGSSAIGSSAADLVVSTGNDKFLEFLVQGIGRNLSISAPVLSS